MRNLYGQGLGAGKQQGNSKLVLHVLWFEQSLEINDMSFIKSRTVYEIIKTFFLLAVKDRKRTRHADLQEKNFLIKDIIEKSMRIRIHTTIQASAEQ